MANGMYNMTSSAQIRSWSVGFSDGSRSLVCPARPHMHARIWAKCKHYSWFLHCEHENNTIPSFKYAVGG